MNSQIRKVNFLEELHYVRFDDHMEHSATMTLLHRAKEMKFVGMEEVDFKDQAPEEGKEEEYQTYAQVWEETGPAMNKTLEVDEIVMKEVIREERESGLLGEAMYNRLQEVQEALLHYIRLCTLNTFFDDIPQAIAVAIRDNNWNVIKEVITLMEVEYCPLKDFDFEVLDNDLELEEDDYYRLVDKVQKDVLEHYEANITEGIGRSSSRRWKDHLEFLNKPIELYTKEKTKFIKVYFSIFDAGIKLSLINNVFYDGKPFAKKFIEWKFPDELLLEEPYRILFPPLVCADRKFSCNFAAPDKSVFPEYRTVDDIRSLPDEFVSKISLSKQPGKLLLLLIRMNLKDMVFFCLENGLFVNLRADSGHCMSLKWINEEGNFAEVKTGELSKPRNQLLEREFSFETPLSVAVETAVYGAETDIVTRLLEEGANPLLCSDIAVKRCINAVSLLATPKNLHINSIPYPDGFQRPSQEKQPASTVEKLLVEPKLAEKTKEKRPSRVDTKNKRRRSNVAQSTFLKRGSVNEGTLEPKNAEIRAVMAQRRKSGTSVKALTSNFEKKPTEKVESPIKRTISGGSTKSLISNFENDKAKKPKRRKWSEKRDRARRTTSSRIDSFDKKIKSEVLPSNKTARLESNNSQVSRETNESGKVKPQSSRIDSGSSVDSSGSKSKKRSRKRKFARKRTQFKRSGLRLGSRTASKADSEFNLSNPEQASKKPAAGKPILRREPRRITEEHDLPHGSKEHLARVRANRVLKQLLKAAESYKKLKPNHVTKILLYQACLEGREDAIRVILESKNMQRLREVRIARLKSGISATSEAESVTTWNVDAELPLSILQAQGVLDEDNFDMIVYVLDKFLNDGLKNIYPNYDSLLKPLYIIMKRYKLYPNNWRFVQLFHILKLAMKQNLAGDREIVLKFLELPQMQHYLNLKKKAIWERVRFENKMYSKSKRADLKIEAPTLTNDELFELDEATLHTGLTRKEIVPKETGQIDKLFKYATKMESLDIIQCLVQAGAFPATKTAAHMMAMSVKSQNVDIIKHVYKNFQLKTMLTKAFIIALKGKYHQSMRVVFELGFSIHPEQDTLMHDRVPVKKATSLTDARLRQLLSLFSNAIDDVLFERTVFDKDDGRRHKFNFTRQDEEETFYLLVDFLCRNVGLNHLKGIVNKIVKRSIGVHESRIWFYGYHYVLRKIVDNGYFELISNDFIEIYKLNYGQWLMYIRELETKFRKQREREFRERALSRSSRRLRAAAAKLEPPEYSPIDNEAFVTMAKSSVKETLEEIFRKDHPSIGALYMAVEEMVEVVQAARGTEKTPRESVKQNCRRSGSRNYDFMSLNNALHGSSGIL